MNRGLRAVMLFLLNRRYIGGKHFPEKNIVKAKTRYLQKKEMRDFEKEYKEVVNAVFLLRSKKRTGKGSDWHISLNPNKLKELLEMLEENDKE